MNHFQQTLVLAASPAAVYAALTTPAGLRGWWTEDCDVAVETGAELRFRFGANHKEMRIEHLEPGREVRWLCVGAHIAAGQLARRDEWIGTRLVFRIAAEGAGRTRLEFEHLGLVPEFECYGMCSSGWRHYMASLARFVETGVGTPHRLPATALAA
jgi:uncharacterized protein YndB with AHSA1/START domain